MECWRDFGHDDTDISKSRFEAMIANEQLIICAI